MGKIKAQTQVENVDFTNEATWDSLLKLEHIDRIVATDVVYHSVLVDKLAKLIRAIKDKHRLCEIEVMIPRGRSTQNAFLDSMRE